MTVILFSSSLQKAFSFHYLYHVQELLPEQRANERLCIFVHAFHQGIHFNQGYLLFQPRRLFFAQTMCLERTCFNVSFHSWHCSSRFGRSVFFIPGSIRLKASFFCLNFCATINGHENSNETFVGNF